MSPGEMVSRSLLDKPLNQLTEDDISQLTREDCRRYLKEKGMRRPSWNKSQAIQQVISLKALFEATTDSEATESPKKLNSVPSNPVVSVKRTRETVLYRRHDPPKPDVLLAADIDSISPRTKVAANEPVGQMTIFYGGKVNVYDDVPGDKAQAVMQLAASPLPIAPSEGNTEVWSIPCHLQPTGVKVGSTSPVLIFPTLQTVKVAENCHLPQEESYISCEDSHDGPTGRKASVQRYREKRKDRFKNKKKVAMPSSAGLDIYLNHLTRDEISNEQLSQSDVCLTPRSRPPNMPISCSLVENFSLVTNHSANLNDKGMLSIERTDQL
ncbi:protein TIFY 4B-like isoform X2 [Mangifera indica]|uniref:protein TIFY 4B-like isoform X2 n=1 Tax=Mangifera indica TaxID=29780 RepID=UPI001CFB1E44|nr:protein TIFY 4B-like isoform X2 [Mangifera indica]